MHPVVAGTVILLAVTALPYLGFIALFAWIRPTGSLAEKDDVTPTMSVVIPTYNESDIIEKKLDDIFSQDYPMEQVEVVLADESSDNTVEVARTAFEDRNNPSLTVVERSERRGVAASVNDAVAAASGDLIFRTDCDSTLGRDALREAASNLADSDIGVVTGQQTDIIGDSQVEQDYRTIQAYIQALESTLDSTFIVHGPCMAFRRADFKPVAPDTIADDTEIAITQRRAGKRVIVDPELTFAESGVSDLRKRRQRKDRRALGLLQLLVRHRDLLGKYGLYGHVVLPFNWWFMIIGPWLILLGALLMSVSALLLLGPLGLIVPASMVGFVLLGQRDMLGVLQPLHAIVDSQLSLLIATVRLLQGVDDGTWAVDRESREAFE